MNRKNHMLCHILTILNQKSSTRRQKVTKSIDFLTLEKLVFHLQSYMVKVVSIYKLAEN